MIKRVLAGLLALIVVVVLGFAGYGWWTRRGEPTFSRGGDGAAPVVPAAILAEDTARSRAAAGVERASSSGAGPRTARAEPTQRARRTASARRSEVAVKPATPGTYGFRGSGSERVRFGGASACSWDVADVTARIKRNGNEVVTDTTYSENHEDRQIVEFRDDGIYMTYYAAAITCVGVRETSEDTYEPPALRVKLPLRVGSSWTQTTKTENRTERIEGKVRARETIRVPAGRFEAYRITMSAEISDGQSGSNTTTFWFSPALGMNVKEDSHTEARQGDATYTSDYVIELSRLP